MKASKNREKRSVVGENALKQNLPSLSHGYGAGRCCQQLCLHDTVMYAKMSLLSGGRGHRPPKQRHEGLRAQSEGKRGLEGAAGTWAVQKKKKGASCATNAKKAKNGSAAEVSPFFAMPCNAAALRGRRGAVLSPTGLFLRAGCAALLCKASIYEGCARPAQ